MTEVKKTVIITGAAGGMGRETCRYLALQGWKVLAIDHNQVRLAELAQSHVHIKPLFADLTDITLVSQVQHQLQDMPPVMGLVNLAGASIGNTIDLLEEDDWQQSFAINVSPAMRLIQ
ncbi:MAG TPA: SDR family NAD(P)-dependent oxidoreductase, partial [Agitococcus sp.]|nr:SDR family NAD(P)-dependent oxidoreductase [Agitococcus sp.]